MIRETTWKVFSAMKKIAFALIALAAIFGFSASASAYPPDGPDVTVSTPTPLPGDTVVLGVSGCAPGDTIGVTVDGTTTTGTADASGDASVSVTAPSTPGEYPVTVSCGGNTTTVNINVLPAGPPTNGGTNGGSTPTGGLPATGSDGTSSLMMLGLGALIVGGGLFGVSQIRRRQTLNA